MHAPRPHRRAKRAVEPPLPETPVGDLEAGDGGEHDFAAVLLHRFQNGHSWSAQRHQMRGVGLGAAGRQDQHPFREIDFAPLQVTDLGEPCAGQQQQLEDLAILAEAIAGVPSPEAQDKSLLSAQTSAGKNPALRLGVPQ